MAKIITIDTLSKFFESLKTYFVTRAEYEIDINVPSDIILVIYKFVATTEKPH